jgi:hypothetical protein
VFWEDAARLADALGPAARRDLLQVLTSPSEVRADVIRQLHERPDGQEMADLLIFLEEWDWARQGMIEECLAPRREILLVRVAGPICGNGGVDSGLAWAWQGGVASLKTQGGDAMGLFVVKTPNVAPVRAALSMAYRSEQLEPEVAAELATAEAPDVAQSVAASTEKRYILNRIIFAVAFFLLLLAIAVAAEAFEWVADPTRIYDFAGLVLAVIIGFISGEGSD